MMDNISSARNEAGEVLPFDRLSKERDVSRAVLIISMWTDILNARLLAVMALVGALCIWLYCAYDPSILRLWASGLYSLVLWPVIYLYAKKGS